MTETPADNSPKDETADSDTAPRGTDNSPHAADGSAGHSDPATRDTVEQSASHMEETIGEDLVGNPKGKAASGFLLATAPDATTPTTRMHADISLTGAEDLLNTESMRYEDLKELGTGGSALVLSAHDSFFNRDVAVKILHRKSKSGKQRIKKFLHEAQMTAQLEHPNILPVFDMRTSTDGECYFTMRKADGVTLRDAIRLLAEDPGYSGPVKSFNDRINVFLKICDAVAYAHDKDIIHRDIKPDNIMLGKFGEVVVVDWGSAVTEAESLEQRNKLVGTPAYMAPEQARREEATKASDVYCLGSSLFHLLTLRHVMWSTDSDEFWEKKRKGQIDPITDAEHAIIPPRLLAIAEKAIAFDVQERYASVLDMIEDLKSYQAGQGVSAYRDSIVDLLHRWYRENKKVFWVSVVSACLIVLAAFAWYNEKLKEMRSWKLFYEEDFSNVDVAELSERWGVKYFNYWSMINTTLLDLDGGVDGRVVAHEQALSLNGEFANGCYNLGFKDSVGENIRVEWDLTPTKGNTDLNAYIGGPWRDQSYIFHVAGHGNDRHIALTRPGYKVFLAVRRFENPFEIGKTYRMQMIKENDTIEMYMNGEQAISYHDLEVLNGPDHQGFGFEMSSSNYKIDNVKVYTQPLPQKISPLAVPDSYYQQGMHELALKQYQSLQNAYPNTAIASAALLGIGRCYSHLERRSEASKYFEQLVGENPDTEIAALALFDMLQNYIVLDNWDAAIHTAERMRKTIIGHSIKRPFFLVLQSYILQHHGLSNRDDWLMLPKAKELILAQHAVIMDYAKDFGVAAEDLSSIKRLGDLLNSLGEHELVLELMPDNDNLVIGALFGLGRHDEAMRRFSGNRRLHISMLRTREQWEEMERLYPEEFLKFNSGVLLSQGRIDEYKAYNKGNRGAEATLLLRDGDRETVYKNYKDTRVQWLSAALGLGHFEEVIKMNVSQYWQQAHAMHALGRELELLEWKNYPLASPTRMTTYFRLAVKALMKNNKDEAEKWIEKIEAVTISSSSPHFTVFAIPSFVRHMGIDGYDPEACRAAYRALAEKVKGKWGNNRYDYVLYLCGDMSEEDYREGGGGEGDRVAHQNGIRAELNGEPAAALAIYEAGLAEASGYNDFKIFLEWRIEALKRQINE